MYRYSASWVEAEMRTAGNSPAEVMESSSWAIQVVVGRRWTRVEVFSRALGSSPA